MNGNRSTILPALFAVLGILVAATTVSPGDITKVWEFSRTGDYVLSDPTEIRINTSGPGHAELVLQPEEIYRTTYSNYFAADVLDGLVFGHSAGLRLRGQPGSYNYPGTFTSRILDKGVAGGWQMINSKIDNAIFDTQSAVGEIDPGMDGLIALLHMNNSWKDEVSGKMLPLLPLPDLRLTPP